ncbi:MAG: hypothetical protein PVI00_04645 [Desulfobacterales bacterium]|jgi:hypothetical protein
MKKKGGNMYAKLLTISLVVAVGAMIGGQLPTGLAGDKGNPVKIYESCIVKKIEKCELLAEILYTSKSITLRNYATVQDQKAQFFDFERQKLIDAMIQIQLEPKQYKIEHFLDQQFYRSLAK